MNKLHYAVIGSGGIGGFYGGFLAKAGKQVDFLFHSDYEHVVQHGLQIDSPLGDFHLPQVSAFHSTQDMPPCDVILVGLKTTNNHLLKTLLPPLLKPETLVILIQNGFGLEEDLLKEFPSLNLAAGLAFICSQKSSDGHITHLDYGKLTLAAYNQLAEPIVARVAEDMRQAGLEVEHAPDLASARWKKLVWNVPFNGSTVVLDTTTKQLVDNPDTYQLMYDLMKEVMTGANACGIKYPIEESFIQAMLEMTKKMTPYSPSMKLDYDNHRPMEIDYIYTRPLQTAQQAGVDMKKIAMLEKLLRFKAIGTVK
ncbi:MAG: putative 2-dehydropantoate 2-reductase [Enterobacteriaceae bacterium]|jgi:2-dehydropantoate 2-reductase|nr:putative 2-dehydropantoate 2-reductase [Enterobacteriaceae bacterium]